MKRLLLPILLLFSGIVTAQKTPDYGLYRIRIVDTNKIIQAEIQPVTSKVHPERQLFYYWYNANTIHFSQGGFSGNLLNGTYTEYYLKLNLQKQGNFKNGLKDGKWKSWNEDGTLREISQWKNGSRLADTAVSFWSRFNLLKKKRLDKKKQAGYHRS